MPYYSAGDGPTPEPGDVRLDAPAFHRNIAPILSALDDLLPPPPADILEIGCGTGQHITAFAREFPEHRWWPTDIAAQHLASTRAWMRESAAGNIATPVLLDAAAAEWDLGRSGRPPRKVRVIFSANVIHISPWSTTTGLLAGAGRHLEPGGSLLLYGPFRFDGHHTAASNQAFDQSLREQNPQWGVRDTSDLAATATPEGLDLVATTDMPANNFMLCFKRR